MRTHIPVARTFLAALLAVAMLGTVTTARAPAPPSEPGDLPAKARCWSIKTVICTDCPSCISKLCDARASDGPFSECVPEQFEACPGYTCGDATGVVGPPCN